MRRAAILAFSAAGALACLAVALLAWRQGRDRSLDDVLESGTIRIGYAIEAPHAFLTDGGEVTGQSPEVARHVALRLGARAVEWRLADFSALLTELEEGRIDVVAAGMFITPERALRVRFSEPIFHVQPALLVAHANPFRLHSYRDALARPGTRVAVLSGSVEADLLRGLGLPEAQLLQVPDAQTGLVAVETCEADALALSSPTIQWMELREQLGRTEMARPFAHEPDPASRAGYGAFAFRRGDKALLRAWNAAQAAVLASPEYRRIMAQFGFTDAEFPGNVTTQEIVGQ